MRFSMLLAVLLATGCRDRHHVVIDDWVPPPDATASPTRPADEDAGAFAVEPVELDAAEPLDDAELEPAEEPGADDAADEEEASAESDVADEEEATGVEETLGEPGGASLLAGIPGYGAVERSDDGTVVVPAENRERGTRPGVESAEAVAQLLLAAIAADDPALAVGTMFPLDAFLILKDLRDPGAYLQRMTRWYEEDVRKERENLGRFDELTFERFQIGYCTWQEEQTEGNLLPYWSCRHNRIYARKDSRPVTIEIHAMINWGTSWYVVHLGPVRR